MSTVCLMDCDAGYGSVANLVDAGRVLRYDCSDFEKAEQVYWALYFGRIKCDLVVVDSISTLLTNTIQAVTLGNMKVNPAQGKTIWSMRDKARTNQDLWGIVNFNMIWFINQLRGLPIPSIINAHEVERSDPTAEETDPGRDPKTGEVNRHMPKLTPKVLLQLMALSDLTLRLYQTPLAFIDYTGQAWPKDTRVLELESASDSYTGIRLTPDATAALPPYIAAPSLEKLFRTIGHLPKSLTVYGFPKVGKTVFSCTLPV